MMFKYPNSNWDINEVNNSPSLAEAIMFINTYIQNGQK